MIYRAAAALPYEDRSRALPGLRGQLRIMAVAAGTTPDWTTLTVAGPDERVGAQSPTRFEWHASVVVHGGTRSFRLPDLVPCPSADADDCRTAPLPAVR
ncbi:hypothetical protein [Petropleomorpha daqingensis]|uniref:Uncharacterized protein n=1 Tax=Petropleomorpha daqingensis TaxID=2026353 RepID=A0A853CGQ4_9ACTN|nr:hypothetical protein [Petropleomorpha daqingensis]NYJ06416.1 hypothetical protein [Petropleomorpha daqingensis]